MINYFRKHTVSSIGVLMLIIVFSFYFHGLIKVNVNYHPVWNDEFFYFINANAYFQNNTLQAALTLNGIGSVIFKSDAHGFIYPLLHGGFAKLVGWHTFNLIWFNFLLIGISLCLIFYLLPIPFNSKLNVTLIMLLFPFIPLYAFTYMQEIMQVFFAIVISILFYHISQKNNNKGLILVLVLIIILSSLFRASWFFWLIGLLPFAKNKLQQIYFSILFILGFIASIVYINLFSEAVPNYFSNMLSLLLKGEVYEVTHSLFFHTLQNIKLYFFSTNKSLVYFSMKFLTAGTIAFFSYDAIKSKDKLSMSILLIGFVNFILVFIFYDANYWREIRTLSPLFYFTILFLVLKLQKRSLYLLICFLFGLFTLSFKISNQQIKERSNMSNFNQKEHDAFQLLAQHIAKDQVVLINNLSIEHTWFMMYLPLQNKHKQPIKYMIPFYGLQNKLYNFTLSKTLSQNHGKLVLATPYFALYKN
ncbi:MAG TPA: hypothetical protein PK323_11340 [Bacteroidia bacterium]|nr:hypothetical protein [Bacteroidia bacterium]